jgi:hypothetical protein
MKIGAVKGTIDLAARKRKFDRIFYSFGPIWIKFGTGINILLNEYEFRKKKKRYATVYLGAQMNFYPYFPNLLPDLWKFRYNSSVHNAVQHL